MTAQPRPRSILTLLLVLLVLFLQTPLVYTNPLPLSPQKIKRETNAQRLAAGLPPLSPRRLYDPSRTVSPRQVPSVSPMPFSGYLQLRENRTGVEIWQLAERGYIGRDVGRAGTGTQGM